jgi:cytoskeleton protein RodZ
MTELGRELADARARAGLSLEELSRRTKISVPTLQLIERSQFRDLPGGIYTRGLLRAYAREVGRDPEDVVNRFRTDVGERIDALQMLDRIAAATNGERVERLHSSDIDAADRRRSFTNGLVFVLALLLGSALYVAADRMNRRPPTSPKPALTASTDVAQPSPAPATPKTPVPTAPTPAAADTAATAATPPNEDPAPKPVGTASVDSASAADHTEPAEHGPVALRLDIHPRDLCWLSATADGALVIYRLLAPGEHALVDAKDAVDLRIGDPAAFSFTINGVAARAPGAAGEAVDIHLTPQNYREFLAP